MQFMSKKSLEVYFQATVNFSENDRQHYDNRNWMLGNRDEIHQMRFLDILLAMLLSRLMAFPQ